MTDQEITRLLKTFLRDVTSRNKIIEVLDVYFKEAVPKADLKKVSEVPFSSERKYSACVYPKMSLVLGAPEMLLSKDSAAFKQADTYAKESYRVVVFGQVAGEIKESAEIKGKFQPLLVAAMEDPVRKEARETLLELTKNKMEYRIISGDSAETVAAIAGRIDSTYPARVISGEELSALSGEVLEKAILEHNIYARIKPQQKQQIIRTLKNNKLFTIMIGDGVNDVLALRESDLGIAMNAGSSMAKDVADVVLLNNSFASLPLLLSESRRIITNIQTLANIYLIKNISFIASILMLGFIGLRFPFDPEHVEITSLLTIGIPSIFLALEKHNFAITDEGFLKRLIIFSAVVGFINSVVFVSLYTYFDVTSEKLFYSRTMLLTAVMFTGINNLVLIYLQHYNFREILQRRLFVALLGLIIVLFILVYVFPVTKEFFKISDVEPMDFLISFGLSAAGSILAVLWLRKLGMTKG